MRLLLLTLASAETGGVDSDAPNCQLDTEGFQPPQLVDLNGDGTPEALVTARFDQVSAFTFDGDAFGPITTLGSPDLPAAVLPADLDGDGDIDLVVHSAYDTRVTAWMNDGANNFTVVDVTCVDARAVATLDLDADGDLDIVVATRSRLRWFENRGDSWRRKGARNVNGTPSELVVSDIDGDGREDVFAIDTNDKRAMAYLNDGSGLSRGSAFSGGIGLNVQEGFRNADWDGDGDLDLAWGRHDGVRWMERVDGALQPHTQVPNEMEDTLFVSVMDVDGDGMLDITLQQMDANNGWHPFWQRRTAEGVEELRSLPGELVAAADIDGDGLIDGLFEVLDGDGEPALGWAKRVSMDDWAEPVVLSTRTCDDPDIDEAERDNSPVCFGRTCGTGPAAPALALVLLMGVLRRRNPR